LEGLRLAEFIYEQPAFPDTEYTFKHALTQEVAYNSTLAERRRLLHERAGQAMEALYADRLEDHLSELAHHFDRSDNIPKAVEYLGRAGERAAQQVAHPEAIGYFNRALELLRRLPDGAARDRQELDLQMALSWSLFVAKGFLTSERESAVVRARELSEQLGESAKLMEALLALAHIRSNGRDFEQARELAERVLAMAERAEASEMLAGAHFVLGYVRYETGRFAEAREHLERAVELFASGPSRNLGGFLAQAASSVLVSVLCVLGYLSTALSRADELVATVRRSSDPYSTATALVNDGFIHLAFRDTRVVAERADEILSIAIENEIPSYSIYATFFRGWATAAAGRGNEGIADMRRCISDPVLHPASASLAFLLALAQTCGENRHAEEGLDLVSEGLATAEQAGYRVLEAELYRVKGELQMIKEHANVAEAEQSLRTAIDVARRQEARLFELRATVSLARLLKRHGKAEQARQMLAEIYGWFTEGFDTADLKDAKALLDELDTAIGTR
jgi:tetratricopeptide (TPR) repeat protein